MEAPRDDELMLAAGRGDQDAFAVLVERHHRTILRFIGRFLGGGDREWAEDLTQEVFLASWKAAPDFRPRENIRVLSWLLRIATNVALNHRRGRRLRDVAYLEMDTGQEPRARAADQPEERSAARENIEAVQKAVADLLPNQRAAILLRHYEGLSYAEIARILETSIPAVESLLFRARTALQQALTAGEPSAPTAIDPRT